ncbi:12520_t:CDS:2 [Entrophospora sp. SA101]|nr:12520_t:CDS:2 [Entrophospora sp. SA101]
MKFKVTRSVDAVHFMQPIKVGDFLIIQASVNRSWNTSMEVGVRVETENPITGKRKYCCHAYLTFVALNPGDKTALGRFRYNNSPAKVSQLVPSTTIEMARYELAETRRQSRISQSKNMDEKGRIEKTKLAELRELMREWSKNKNTEMMSDAEIPPLLPDLDNDNEAKGKDPAKLLLRRRSTLQGTLPLQPDDKLTLESFAEIVETVMPQNANTLQITFGGQIMKWMEQCSIVSASRHSRRFLLLASIDSLQFLRPTYVGDSIIVRSLVTCTFHSSLEVYVCVEAENLFTGESYFTNDGFYTMDEIFEILYKDGSLGSLSNCATVNKQWYVLVIPKLWRHPFYPSRIIFKESCINSIIPFLPPLTYKKSIKLLPFNYLTHNHGNSRNKPFYNYLQYLQIFDLSRIETDSRYWVKENIKYPIENQSESESEIENEISFKLARSLYEYFINHSLNIHTIILDMNNDYMKQQNLSPSIEEELNIFLYPNAKTNLTKIKTLITHGEYVNGLLATASQILCNLKEIQFILTNTNYFATTFQDLGKLIESQRSLENLLIKCSRSKPLGFKNIFQSLIDTQLESLTTLTLENVDFQNEFPFKLFILLKELKYLKLERCINFGNITGGSEQTISNCSNYLTLLTNYCQNLKCFSGTINLEQQQQMMDLIEFLKASKNLEKITINELKKLRTNGRLSRHVWIIDKPIITANTTTTNHGLFNEFLPEIGKFLPNTIKTFKFQGVLLFSPDCLKQFLANCKSDLKYLGFANCKDFSNAHLQIIIDYIEKKRKNGVGETLKRLNVKSCYLIKLKDLAYAKNFIKIINSNLDRIK